MTSFLLLFVELFSCFHCSAHEHIKLLGAFSGPDVFMESTRKDTSSQPADPVDLASPASVRGGLNSVSSLPFFFCLCCPHTPRFVYVHRDVALAFKAVDHSTPADWSASSIPLASSIPAARVLALVPLAFVPPPGDSAKNDPASAAHEVFSTAYKVLTFLFFFFSCYGPFSSP